MASSSFAAQQLLHDLDHFPCSSCQPSGGASPSREARPKESEPPPESIPPSAARECPKRVLLIFEQFFTIKGVPSIPPSPARSQDRVGSCVPKRSPAQSVHPHWPQVLCGKVGWQGRERHRTIKGYDSKSKMTSWKFCVKHILIGSWPPRTTATLPARGF